MPRAGRLALIAAAAIGVGVAAAAATPTERIDAMRASAAPNAPDAARAGEILHLLKQDCGSCHGMRLTGGLGPPLTAAALRTKPAESLVATIMSGRPGTAMPPWRRFLTEAEAEWLVARMVADDVDAP